MKNFFIYIFIFVGILISSCSKDTSTILVGPKWKVSYYYENNSDKTSKFAGYTFEFTSNGAYKATTGDGTIYDGSWIEDVSNSKLIFTGPNSAALDNFNNSWIVISKSSSEIKLKDDNTSKTEELTLIKI